MKIYDKIFGVMTCAIAAIVPCNAKTTILTTPPNFQVMSMSPNGKWACGVYLDQSAQTYGFRWNLESGSIDVLGGECSVAWDVSNDGTVSGEFNDYSQLGNGSALILPGYWRSGLWHNMQMPQGTISDGIAGGISPDGRFISATVNVNGKYTPYIWENGQIIRDLGTDNHAVAYAVAPDGSAAAGFNTRYNRTAAVWTAEGSLVHLDDSPLMSESPWNYARNFSPDGKKLVYWGGWELSDNEKDLYLYCIYDVATGERKKVHAEAYNSVVEYHDISNNEMLVGSEFGRGYVWVEGSGMYIDDYLAMRNVDLTDLEIYNGDEYDGVLPIEVIVAVSEDENALAMRYYDNKGYPRSIVIKMDQNEEQAPAEFTAEQLTGINTVALKWKRAQGSTTIRGYNVYCDNRKLNGVLPLNVPYYFDNNVENGKHSYHVTAVMTNGSEISSDKIEIDIKSREHEAPLNVYCRQKGVNNAFLSWNKPMSNIIHKHYFTSTDNIYKPFYIYEDLEFETAIAYDKEEMKAYRGSKISEVSFVPLAQHYGWLINIYTHDNDGSLQQIYSQPVTQDLNIDELNTVKLDTPVDVPDGALIIAVECHSDGISYKTIGIDNSKVVAGKSDLIRLTDEDDFMSVYDTSLESLSMACFSWSIDFGLSAAEDVQLDPSSYNVYSDNTLLANTPDTHYVVESLSQGVHNFAIEAVYTDSNSPRISTSTVITDNFPAVEIGTLEIDNSTVKASWTTPADNDLTDFSYTKSGSAASGIITNTNYFIAAVEFPSSMFNTFEDYKVNTLRFYPMTDANYVFVIYDNEEMTYVHPVTEYTVNEWNSIVPTSEITFERGHTYRLAVECSLYDPSAHLLGLDSNPGREFITDLYTIDGDYWASLTEDLGTSGNWMIGMTLVDRESKTLDVDGYDVIVDGRKVATKISETDYQHTFSSVDSKKHSLRVDTYYTDKRSTVKGGITYFYLSSSGISDAAITDIRLSRGGNYLVAEGDGIKVISIFDITGQEVAASHGNKVEISHLKCGVYVVKVDTGNGSMISKILISKD